jgi:hypothetical protein
MSTGPASDPTLPAKDPKHWAHSSMAWNRDLAGPESGRNLQPIHELGILSPAREGEVERGMAVWSPTCRDLPLKGHQSVTGSSGDAQSGF